MYPSLKRIIFSLLSISLLLAALCGCDSNSPTNVVPTPTPNPYALSGGGACVKLSSHPKPPYMNVQVSHDTYLDHSEPMLVEDPTNPLHLVGGSKFFTDPAHYRFQIGYFASFDGGCTWTDGGVLPGFDKNALTSDISFAFDTHGHVYAAVLFSGPKSASGIAVSTSNDGGKTFGVPVIVYSQSGLPGF